MTSGAGDNELTEKQAQFVKEYLVDLNGTKAVIRAGYSENGAASQANQLLRLVKVRDAVDEGKKRLGHAIGVRAEDVLNELRRVAFSELRRIAEWEGDKMELVPSHELSDDDSAAILSIESKKKIRSTDDGTEETVEMKVKLHDKMRAIEMLGRHLGFFNADKSGANAAPITVLTAEQAKQILNADFATQKPDELPKVEPL